MYIRDHALLFIIQFLPRGSRNGDILGKGKLRAVEHTDGPVNSRAKPLASQCKVGILV